MRSALRDEPDNLMFEAETTVNTCPIEKKTWGNERHCVRRRGNQTDPSADGIECFWLVCIGRKRAKLKSGAVGKGADPLMWIEVRLSCSRNEDVGKSL